MADNNNLDDDLEDLTKDLEETIKDLNKTTGTKDDADKGDDTSKKDDSKDDSSKKDDSKDDKGDIKDGGKDDTKDEGTKEPEPKNEERIDDSPEPTFEGITTAPEKPKKKQNDAIPPNGIKFAPVGPMPYEYSKIKDEDFGKVIYSYLMRFFEWLLKNAVDLATNFADYVLYKSLNQLKKYPPTPPNEEKTIFDYGREIETGYAEKAAKGIAFYKSAKNEVLENIERNKRGEPLEWKVIGKEPTWFQEAVKIEKEAAADPQSEAYLKWETFKNSDKIIEGKLGNDAVYHIIATRIATFEEALKGEKFKLPENIIKQTKKMEDIFNKEGIKPEDMKKQMLEEIEKTRKQVESGGYVNNKINEQLDAMELVANSKEEISPADMKKAFQTSIKEIREINPTEETLKTLSREDYENVRKNLDKISEKYKGDTDKIIKVSAEYVNGVIGAINKCQDDVVRYAESSRFSKSKAAQATKKTIYGVINKAGDYIGKDGKPLLTLHTQKEKAEKGIKSIKSAISDFMVENKKISEYDDAKERSSAPSMDRATMLKRMSGYFQQR